MKFIMPCSFLFCFIVCFGSDKGMRGGRFVFVGDLHENATRKLCGPLAQRYGDQLLVTVKKKNNLDHRHVLMMSHDTTNE